MDPTYPLVPILNFIAVALILISLFPNGCRAWNTGVHLLGLWVAVMALITGINTIVWSDNVDNVAPIWCDISTHIEVASVVGIPACSFIITRRLDEITRHRNRTTSKGVKRRETLFDLSFCLILPILVMGWYYVVQGARFVILEEKGCTNTVVECGVAFILIQSWSLILPGISVLLYCPKIIWMYYRHRREMSEAVANDPSVKHGNYYRLLALGSFDALVTIPITVISLVSSTRGVPFQFWTGWSFIHSDWSPVLIPASEFLHQTKFSIKWDMWINVVYGIIIFLLFGLTSEARSRYANAFWFAVRPLGLKPPTRPDVSDVVFGSVEVQQAGTSTQHDRSYDEYQTSSGAEAFEHSSSLERENEKVEMQVLTDSQESVSARGSK